MKENGNNNPRGFKYIIEAHNNGDPDRTKKFTVLVVLHDRGKQRNQYVLDRIERFMISSDLVNLKNLGLLIKCYPMISGGAISVSFSANIYEK